MERNVVVLGLIYVNVQKDNAVGRVYALKYARNAFNIVKKACGIGWI